MYPWRLYIDESGDHTYKHVDDLEKRYLGLTGVLFPKQRYDDDAQPRLEEMKQSIFRYDPDDPPILTRSDIRNRKRWFYVLQDAGLNKRWEEELLAYLGRITRYGMAFTVVIDKWQHLEDYPFQTFDPYVYSLSVLLNRVRGYLTLHRGQADVIAESRGTVEDNQIKQAYKSLREHGSRYGDGAYYQSAFPAPELGIKKKNQNIAELQIADVLAYGQKIATIQESNKSAPRALTNYGQRINEVVQHMVNPYGRYMLN